MLIIYYCQTLFGQQNGYESVKHISKLSFKNYISSVHLTVKIMKQIQTKSRNAKARR